MCTTSANTLEMFPISRLVQVAELAGFLKLQGSDLVFSNNEQGLIYYDCILSCRWSDYGVVSYLAVLDQKTNVTEIRQYKIPKSKLETLYNLPVSDLTTAAMSCYFWRSLLKKKNVLILVGDWLQQDNVGSQSANDEERNTNYDNRTYFNAMELLHSMAQDCEISFHIEMIETNNSSTDKTDEKSSSNVPRKSPIMLRLMMCKNQPSTYEIPDKQLKSFYTTVMRKSSPICSLRRWGILCGLLW